VSPEEVRIEINRIDLEHWNAVDALIDRAKSAGVDLDYDWHDGIHKIDGKWIDES
jgi:predicted esterase